MPVFLHSEQTEFTLTHPQFVEKWIHETINDEGNSPGDISIILTNNEYLLEINSKYLNHNYFTDVITFDYSDSEIISGDVFVSVDQVRINAAEYNEDFNRELMRVIIHGILHLLGYDDSTDEEREMMREKENRALDRIILKEDGDAL